MTALPRPQRYLTAARLALPLATSLILAQAPVTLETLTVPSGRLPNGCQLEVPAAVPASAAATPSRTLVHGSVRGNPWSGADLQLKVEARNAVDGRPPMPYAPASRRELGSFQAKWVENVAEAYRAQYESDGNDSVLVRAVRFDDPKWATPEPPLGTRVAMRGASARIVLGAIVVRVSAGTNSECYQAVRRYIESLR